MEGTRMTAGYSDTPLGAKLGYKPGMRVWFAHMPDDVRTEIDPRAIGIEELDVASPGLQAAHIFVTERAVLEREIAALRQLIEPGGMIWVSWPKKAAKASTDLTEDVVRAAALPIGLVDVKVCAIDAVWSGLKLMIRKELR